MIDDRTDHPKERKRVRGRIGAHVCTFMTGQNGLSFHAKEVADYISSCTGGYVSPESATRIMRDLRQKKKINYVCIDRADSRYVPLEVKKK